MKFDVLLKCIIDIFLAGLYVRLFFLLNFIVNYNLFQCVEKNLNTTSRKNITMQNKRVVILF